MKTTTATANLTIRERLTACFEAKSVEAIYRFGAGTANDLLDVQVEMARFYATPYTGALQHWCGGGRVIAGFYVSKTRLPILLVADEDARKGWQRGEADGPCPQVVLSLVQSAD